eukprot:scaffold1323_cov160-Amphora_coffeaeformis.AAC.23
MPPCGKYAREIIVVCEAESMDFCSMQISKPSVRSSSLGMRGHPYRYPELYQIRQKSIPKVHKQIHLFDDVMGILQALDQMENPPILALASRTTKTQWAEQLLRDFELEAGRSIHSLFAHVEIRPGSKKSHFSNLRDATGFAYSEMLFYDDDARMNLGEISQLGVLCCHTPRGLTTPHFVKSIQKYSDLKAGHDASHWMGYVLDNENLGIEEINAPVGQVLQGRVKFYSPQKRFGFVLDEASGQEFFFHESKVPSGMDIKSGDNVTFESSADDRGRPSAVILSGNGTQSPAAAGGSPTETVTMPCFSMSQPFAALLLNGVKIVESRNNPMFEKVEPGTQVLLHCGRRDWHDLESYQNILIDQGMSEDEISRKSRLPKGFRKGSIIGVVTVGKTWKTTDVERKGKDLQQRVLAPYEGIGKFCTEITLAQWLTKSEKAGGNPGIYQAQIPKSSLPKN